MTHSPTTESILESTDHQLRNQVQAILKDTELQNRDQHAERSLASGDAVARFQNERGATARSRSEWEPGADQGSSPFRGQPRPGGEHVPLAPRSLRESGLSEAELEGLILKFLLSHGRATGRDIADQIKLPFGLIEDFLYQLKEDRLVLFKAAGPLSDYVYEPTDAGCEKALRYNKSSTYYGAAPVPLADYAGSVAAQTVTEQSPRLADLKNALGELVLKTEVLKQLGQATNSGRGLFLSGSPGNGKTSIAERITRAFGQYVWIPRAISMWGEIVRLYDPSSHEAAPMDEIMTEFEPAQIDARWIRIKRPTIVVGGELTMDNLEIKIIDSTGIAEAPLQLKSNCGTLVIDDFGRQRMQPDELLNRWIVPLEKRFDFLNLTSGRKIQVPFDQLIVFSTNLEPRDLVDEAFLRRIPYKIIVEDPTEPQFRELFLRMAKDLALSCPPPMVDYLVDRHYRAPGRSMRFCHPRDLLNQVKNFCDFEETQPEVTKQAIDAAVKNYFALVG
ncbi:MAG: AAA family ATPase [Pirellulales bacterium]|nr:AAA family ATPase [Pirellulales bacterium]